jgi:O-antigen ligase
MRNGAWIFALVAAAVVVILGVATSGKLSFYLDALDRSHLLYAIPFVAVAGLFVILVYPRLSLHVMAFLLPFNFVGGYWGGDIVVLMAKMAVNLVAAAALVSTFLAPPADRAWLTRTRLGRAVLLWLLAVAIGVVLGLLGASNREYWVRESGWMLFYSAALPFGTLVKTRRDVDRILWTTCAGVAILQLYGFWTLATGTRYARGDAWDAGVSFFRAPYSCVSLFVMCLAAAALLVGSSAKTLTRGAWLLVFLAIAALGGGLLASMVRSMWISGAIGMLVVVLLAPWDRRSAKAAVALATGVVLAVGVVAAIDRLSPSSTGDWTGSAIAFFMDLGSKDSTSRVTREIEWAHAIDIWADSPLVGQGFGYSFPQTNFGKVPAEVIPEAFYMHNSYLNILAKTGAFGLAALLYLLWRTLVGGWTVLHDPTADAHDRIVATALLGGLASVAMLTTTMPVLTAGDPAAYLGMLVGLTAALRRGAPGETP